MRDLQQQLVAASAEPRATGKELIALSDELDHKRQLLATLQHEIGALNMYAELQSFGLYRPHYAFDAPEGYEAELEVMSDREAAMLKDKAAAVFSRQWTVDGSVQKGQQMIARQVKLMLRAFNGECDAALAKVRFNNVIALEERVKSAFAAINKLAETYQCAIAEPFLDAELEARLAEARAQKERAISLAQLTRAGHVYVISNEGSFGSNVYKIGMTRRQELKIAELRLAFEYAVKLKEVREDPEDRVDELGDASVPFAFDIHAMSYRRGEF